MNAHQVLLLLLNALTLKQHKFSLSWAAVSLWHEGVLNTLVDSKLISSKEHATNIQCQGCEKHCIVDVTKRIYPKAIRYYAVCDDPIMHEQMGRMIIPPEQLKQWQLSVKRLACVISGLLGLSSEITYQSAQASINLGSLKSKTGRKSVVLNIEPLMLVVNQVEIPVCDILYFENNKLKLDSERFDVALQSKQGKASKTYTPNVDKNEQRKAKTQAMYQDWQDQASKLKSKHPTKSKTWISQQITKMEISQGKNSETIRKNIQI